MARSTTRRWRRGWWRTRRHASRRASRGNIRRSRGTSRNARRARLGAVPVLVALIPPPSPPEAAGMAYGGMLGDGWTVHAFRSQDEVPDDVAAEVEFLLPAASQRVDHGLLSRSPKLRMLQVPGH